MKRTRFDVPFGQPQVTPPTAFASPGPTYQEQIHEACRKRGLNAQSFYNWKRRHPDCDWSIDRIIDKIMENKARWGHKETQ